MPASGQQPSLRSGHKCRRAFENHFFHFLSILIIIMGVLSTGYGEKQYTPLSDESRRPAPAWHSSLGFASGVMSRRDGTSTFVPRSVMYCSLIYFFTDAIDILQRNFEIIQFFHTSIMCRLLILLAVTPLLEVREIQLNNHINKLELAVTTLLESLNYGLFNIIFNSLLQGVAKVYPHLPPLFPCSTLLL